MKFDDVFEKVNEIPIESVFVKRGYKLKKVGASYCLPSPLRVGGSESSFTISPQRKIFTDWVTSCSGNATKFISLIDEISYFEAGFEIALDFGIIDLDYYNSIINNNGNKPKNHVIYEKKYNKIEKTVSEIADTCILDKVFKLFISMCKLSDTHKKHLIEERGLTEEDIKKFNFFTFPTRAIIRNFIKKIESEGLSQEVLKGIPGFYKRKNDLNFTFFSTKGIGIPIYNEFGYIIGIQIRKDTIKEGEQRYTWFSSSFAIDDMKNEQEFGTSSGSPIDVIYPEENIRKGVFITEGKFKAIQICKKYNCIAISVQGVSTWKPIINILENLQTIMKSKNEKWEIGKIYTAFDADMCCNYSVYKQLKNMTDNICNKINIDVDYLFWDINKGKGIDDIIISKNIESIENYYKDKFDISYKTLIDKIIEINPDINSESDIIKKISSEQFKEFFDKYFIFPKKTIN